MNDNSGRDRKKSENWLETVQRLQREIKRSPDPLKRQNRPIVRMVSERQRIAESQTPNFMRAIDKPDFRPTPTKPENWKGTRNVGSNDMDQDEYRAGKDTTSTGETKGVKEPAKNGEITTEELVRIFRNMGKKRR